AGARRDRHRPDRCRRNRDHHRPARTSPGKIAEPGDEPAPYTVLSRHDLVAAAENEWDVREIPRIGALDRARVWAPDPARPRRESHRERECASTDENAAGRDAQARDPNDPYPRSLVEIPRIGALDRARVWAPDPARP